MRKLLTLFLAAISFVAFAQQNPPQPVDPNVKTGVLENGLTYYVRANSQPENRADFYIAQKVGSMQEEDSQAGLAHFLEHMAFNGTTNFPGKQMLEYLQDNGLGFGSNINAYTSFDETVYFISNVPTTNQNLMDSVLLVLYDWSAGIALEEEEIESERGVIREEWRTRGGAQQRLWEELLPVMYKDSKYANRMPIGDIDVINNFHPDEIRAYYKKWYRPDLQGIIVVGDFDADEMEQKVIELFSDIVMPEDAAVREYYPVHDNVEPVVAFATDVEATGTQIMMFHKHDPMPDEIKQSQAGLVLKYVTDIASNMINARFDEIVQKPNAPFIYAGAYDGDYFVAKTKDAWTVVGASAEDKIEEALAAMTRETERMKRYGFTASEYERARADVLKRYENAYNNRDKERNSKYAQEYVNSFTNADPIPGIEWQYNMMNMMAPNIPVEVINQSVAQLISEENLVIAITGPKKEGLVYPTEEDILAVLNNVRAEEIEAYVEEFSDEPLMAVLPEAGKIAEMSKDEEFDACVWTLENGMKVILKTTDFKDDEILMTASSCGGFSHYAEEHPINSKVMEMFMNIGGVGNHSATDLPKVLAGKTASVNPNVSVTHQGFSGRSSIKDFETMLQLIHLYFTAPRSDQEAFESNIQRYSAMLKNQEAEPSIALVDAAQAALYGDNPLTQRLKLEDLEKVDYELIMNMYKEIFSNPGSFVFTFVGNIDKPAVKPLIEQYLGSLPGQEEITHFKRVNMDFNKGQLENIFQREMQLPKATVFIASTGTVEYNQRNRTLMNMFGRVLRIVYTEKVREDEGGTYGVGVNGQLSRYPEGQTILQISYDTDPEKAEALNKVIFRELKLVADEGPRAEDFNKVKENMLKQYTENLKENSYWRNLLNNKYFYGEDNHSDYLELLNSITADDIQQFAADFLSQDNQALVIMMPTEEAEEN